MAKIVKLSPHQRIMRAAAKGAGVRLTAKEVAYLAMDASIETRALHDDDVAAGLQPTPKNAVWWSRLTKNGYRRLWWRHD